jgi:hypothetical protein
MTLSDDARNRLFNFKFEQAAEKLTDDELISIEGELVCMLASRYGNVGWMDGTEGAFVWAVLALLGVTEEG